MSGDAVMSGLLPCPNPWCISTTPAMPIQHRNGRGNLGRWYVICGCGVRTVVSEATKREAIEAWNRRPPSSEVQSIGLGSQEDGSSRESAPSITAGLTASRAAHTPGPWFYYADLPSVAPNWHIVTTANKLRVLANVHIEPSNGMDIANADLIASAPDLLAALRLCVQRIERPNLSPDANVVLERAHAAIARAAALSSAKPVVSESSRDDLPITSSEGGEPVAKLGKFCPACQAIPVHGFCLLKGCPNDPASPVQSPVSEGGE